MIGTTIKLPNDNSFKIRGIEYKNELEYADYKIVTFVDSIGCTSCKMHLKGWDKYLNALPQLYDGKIAFAMIIDHVESESIKAAISTNRFNHPIYFDSLGWFKKNNYIPDDPALNTFLLDANNNILAVGDPVSNYKIRALYSYYITGNETSSDSINKYFSGENSINIGIIYPNDTIEATLPFLNITNDTLLIKGITTSCPCTAATIHQNTIYPDQLMLVNFTLVGDSLNESFCHSLNIDFYNASFFSVLINGFYKTN